MLTQKTIVCAFCKGSGKNPHFTGTCPVCKGRGNNTVFSPFMPCKDCHRSGQKRGTALTCYTCGGLGVLPDTREVIKKAKREIKKAREEMDRERQEFREKTQPPPARKRTEKVDKKKEIKEAGDESTDPPKEKLFCQCCGHKVQKSSTVKVCLKCFRKIKET